MSSKNKRLQFGYIRDRIYKKLDAWQNKLLSAGGKEVLLKSVIQAVPTYAMMCFKIPASLCEDINRACARFWWGGTVQNKKMHWVRWRNMCRPKDRGGIGLRDLVSFNKALLAKQVWRIMNAPESLLARVMKQKYFKDESVLDAPVRSNASYAWRSLAWSRELIKRGVRWKIGSGDSVRMSCDGFVDGFSGGLPQPLLSASLDRACDFITNDRQWDVDKLQTHFWPPVVEAICRTPIRNVGGDQCYWKFDDKGLYSVKSGYLAEIGYFDENESSSTVTVDDWYKLVWNLDIPPKTKIFLWRAANEAIPVPVNLQNHKLPISGLCEGCGKAWGSTVHCLFFCKITKYFWKETSFWQVMSSSLREGSMMEMLKVLQRSFKAEEYEEWVMLTASVWRYLCDLKYSPEEKKLPVSLTTSREALHIFHAARRSLTVKNPFGVEVGEKTWFPVGEGIYRLDVDACVCYDTDLFGYGAVVRDDQGKIMAALMRPAARPISVLDAEMNALFYGVGLCLQEGIGPIVVFSDSMTTIRALKGVGENESYLKDNAPDIVELVRDGIIRDFRHMYREANNIAHTLARAGASSDSLITWNCDFPSWLRVLVD